MACRGLLERLNSWQSEEASSAAIPVSALMDLAQGTAVTSQLRSAVQLQAAGSK